MIGAHRKLRAGTDGAGALLHHRGIVILFSELSRDDIFTRAHSQLSSRAPTRRSSCILMSGQPQARFVSDDLFPLFTLEENMGANCVAQSFARSAQAEHMVLITEQGAEVLTRP